MDMQPVVWGRWSSGGQTGTQTVSTQTHQCWGEGRRPRGWGTWGRGTPAPGEGLRLGFLGEAGSGLQDERGRGEEGKGLRAEGTAWAKSGGREETVAWSLRCRGVRGEGREGVWEGPGHRLG